MEQTLARHQVSSRLPPTAERNIAYLWSRITSLQWWYDNFQGPGRLTNAALSESDHPATYCKFDIGFLISHQPFCLWKRSAEAHAMLAHVLAWNESLQLLGKTSWHHDGERIAHDLMHSLPKMTLCYPHFVSFSLGRA